MHLRQEEKTTTFYIRLITGISEGLTFNIPLPRIRIFGFIFENNPENKLRNAPIYTIQ